MNIDSEFLKKTLVGLTGIDSPSGYCDKAIAYVGEIAASLGYRFGVTNKGCGVIYVDGRKGQKGRARCSYRYARTYGQVDLCGRQNQIHKDRRSAASYLGRRILPNTYTRRQIVYGNGA